MAVSKIKAIKSTLDKAICYIVNPEKTKEGVLVSSFGCGVGSAAVEMQMTAKQGRMQGSRIGYHLMQSFSPEDDVTPERAHELGREFADKVLKGKYEYIIATHIDGEHIHNHIIFNATSFYSHRKYHYDAGEKSRIMEINDSICHNNNLSVIEKTSGVRGKSRYEYEQSKACNSWKDKLKHSIDDAILKANNFNEFIEYMQMEGYEVKHGKYIAFKAAGQERFIRAKRIGEAYTEDSIRERISSPKKMYNHSKKVDMQKQIKDNSKRINLIIDISSNIKAKESDHYKQALERININTLVKTMNFLIAHDIQTEESFKEYYEPVNNACEKLQDEVNQRDKNIVDLSERIRLMRNYKNYYNIYKNVLKMGENSEYYNEHEKEFISFLEAKVYFNKRNENPYDTKITDLYSEYKQLISQQKKRRQMLRNAKMQLKELNVIKKNIEDALNIKLMDEIPKGDKKHDDVLR